MTTRLRGYVDREQISFIKIYNAQQFKENMKQRKKQKVFIFDYDGTIVGSTFTVFKAFNETAEKYGIKKVSKEDFSKLYNNNLYLSLIKHGIKKDKLMEFASNWRERYSSSYNSRKIFPKMRSIIKSLSASSSIYIITSNWTSVVQSSIKNLGLKGIKQVIGGEIEKSKIIKIKAIKKKHKKADIYYIGDTVGDVKEAKKAGVISVAVSWGLHSLSALKKQRPDYLISKSKNLLKI